MESLPPKLEVVRALLLRGTVFVHLDPRREGVAVPPWLAKQPQLVLQVGLDMAVPIPDLKVDEEGIYGTLSFNRSPFPCAVPWEAVFAMAGDDGKGMVWPDSMPGEILAEVEREQGRRSPPPLSLEADEGSEPEVPGPDDGKVVHLGARRGPRLVRPVAEAPDDGPDDEPPSPRSRELPPYLRVIK